MHFRAWNMHPDGPDILKSSDEATSDPYLFVALDSSPASVRSALARTRQGLLSLSLDGDVASTVEQVLAEVMNNICEHAYCMREDGRIELLVWLDREDLRFETRDTGEPMPDGRLPLARPVIVDCPLEDLPEGGFRLGHDPRACLRSFVLPQGWHQLPRVPDAPRCQACRILTPSVPEVSQFGHNVAIFRG